MARKKTKRAPKPNANGAPKPAETATPAPQPEKIMAWDCGEPNQEAPLIVLLVRLFEDFRGEHPLDDGPIGLLTRVMRANADDAELATAVGDGLDHSDCIARVLTRIESRSKMVVEIARRMAAGEVQS